MNREQLLAEILRLPPDERWRLIWDALDLLPAAVGGISPALERELDRRKQDMVDHPERGSSWEDVSARVRARKK